MELLLLSVLFFNLIFATHGKPTHKEFGQLQEKLDQMEKRYTMEIAELRQVSIKYARRVRENEPTCFD